MQDAISYIRALIFQFKVIILNKIFSITAASNFPRLTLILLNIFKPVLSKTDYYVYKAHLVDYLKGDWDSLEKSLQKYSYYKNNFAKNDVTSSKISFLGNEWSSFGHLSLLDKIIKLKILKIYPNKKFYFFFSDKSKISLPYLNCFKNYLTIKYVPKIFYYFLKYKYHYLFENVSQWTLKNKSLSIYRAWNLCYDKWPANKSLKLFFNAEINKKVSKILPEIKNNNFVCLHVRTGKRGGYARSAADSNILTYKKLVYFLVRKKIHVIIFDPQKRFKYNFYIHYLKTKNKLNKDIQLCLIKRCLFFVGNSSGPLTVAASFNKPILYTNAVQIKQTLKMKNCILVPKLIAEVKNKTPKILSFNKMFSHKISSCVLPKVKNVAYVDNSETDLYEAVKEFYKICKLKQFKFKMNKLNKNYLNILKNAKGIGGIAISNFFLFKYKRHLFEQALLDKAQKQMDVK